MDSAEKTNENRVRRIAERRGMRLAKNRRRDPLAFDFNTYRLTDAQTGRLQLGGVDLRNIESYLARTGPVDRPPVTLTADQGIVVTAAWRALDAARAPDWREHMTQNLGSLETVTAQLLGLITELTGGAR